MKKTKIRYLAIANTPTKRFIAIVALILAGEIIFSLPFHIPRFFRPTMLEVFQLSNTQLGDIFALYGIIALLAYFPGGTIADRYSARALMTLSLVSTALGGLYLYTLPGLTGLYCVFAYWGLTSILLFWAALIKATRDWAGEHSQGLGFGILDAGRGFVASLFATFAVFILSQRLADTGNTPAALQSVILFYSIVSLLAAAAVWFALSGHSPNNSQQKSDGGKIAISSPHWYQVLSDPNVWLQAGVVIFAYCSYKALDNYGVFAVQVMGMDQLEAASLNTYASYSRPVAAIAAGLWADRWRSSKLISLLFFVAASTFLALSQLLPTSTSASIATTLILLNVLVTFVAAYALRGIYFSLIEEAKLDKRITGSAVGLISVLGFTPDIFFAALTGRLLDANPGAAGFQHYFLLMTAICTLGMVFTLILSRQLAGKH